MSTDTRPGLAVNEEEVERHVRETRDQARRANYPDRPTPLHEKAPLTPDSRDSDPSVSTEEERPGQGDG
jgi:hypothetical protein